MDAAVVVIEVAAPEPSADQLSALIGACNQASERAACVLAEHAPEGPARAVAIIKSDGDRVRVDLGLRRSAGDEWHTRELAFEPHDDPLERWRTIGFAIGTLAQAVEDERPAEPEAPPNAPVEPSPQPLKTSEPQRSEPAPAPRAQSPGAWFDGAFGAGPAFDPVRWRAGGTLRTGIELARSGPYFTASTFYAKSLAVSGSRLDLEWLGFAAGVGHPLLGGDGAAGLEARVEATLSRLQVTATDAPRVDRGDRWLFGGRLGVDGTLWLSPWLAAIGSIEGSLQPATDVRISGVLVGSAPAPSVGVWLGARVRVR